MRTFMIQVGILLTAWLLFSAGSVQAYHDEARCQEWYTYKTGKQGVQSRVRPCSEYRPENEGRCGAVTSFYGSGKAGYGGGKAGKKETSADCPTAAQIAKNPGRFEPSAEYGYDFWARHYSDRS